MKHTKLAAWFVIVGLAAPGACTRDKPAAQAPPPAGGAAAPAPEIPIDTMPKVLSSPIIYPPEARSRGEQGIVQVKALVGRDGKVTMVSVDPAQSASPVLKQAAMDAVRQWTIEPARSGGEPREVWIVVPVAFRLGGGPR